MMDLARQWAHYDALKRATKELLLLHHPRYGDELFPLHDLSVLCLFGAFNLAFRDIVNETQLPLPLPT